MYLMWIKSTCVFLLQEKQNAPSASDKRSIDKTVKELLAELEKLKEKNTQVWCFL